jgi:mannose-1-phosphate guanylyltransferase
MDGARAPGASFGPYVTLGVGAHVQAGAHVEDSVLMDGAVVGRDCRLLRTIVGPGARVPKGRRLTDELVAPASV